MGGAVIEQTRVHGEDVGERFHQLICKRRNVRRFFKRKGQKHLALYVHARNDIGDGQISPVSLYKAEDLVCLIRLKGTRVNVDHSVRACLKCAGIRALEGELGLVSVKRGLFGGNGIGNQRVFHAAQALDRIVYAVPFHLKGAFIGHVLRLTAAAGSVMRAKRLASVAGGLDDTQKARVCKAVARVYDFYFNFFARNRFGYKTGAAVRKTADALHFRPSAGNYNDFCIHLFDGAGDRDQLVQVGIEGGAVHGFHDRDIDDLVVADADGTGGDVVS